MTVTWRYALDYAGQLGHVAFRHVELLADFEDPAALERFNEVWRSVFGIVPHSSRHNWEQLLRDTDDQV